MSQLRVVIAGMGAAGIAVAKILHEAGVADIVGVDRQGAIHQGRGELVASKQWIADHTNLEGRKGSLTDVLAGADVFVGVSGPGLVSSDDLRTMAERPIVFALANPDPEILPEQAEGIVAVMATGRSDFANQINNVLCFPGIFRGALDAGRDGHHRADEARGGHGHRQLGSLRRALADVRHPLRPGPSRSHRGWRQPLRRRRGPTGSCARCRHPSWPTWSKAPEAGRLRPATGPGRRAGDHAPGPVGSFSPVPCRYRVRTAGRAIG